MTMFGIPEGTEVRLVPKDTFGSSGFNNTRTYTTKKFKVFDVSELIIDPTGVSKDFQACTPRNAHTIGGAYAEGGWYGFAMGNHYRYPHGDPDKKWYAVLVPAGKVEVN